MVSMKLEDAQVHRMRLIPGLQLQVILLILSGAPGLASANGTRCCRIGEYRWSKLSRHRLWHGCARAWHVPSLPEPILNFGLRIGMCPAQRAVVYLNPQSAIRNGKTGEVQL